MTLRTLFAATSIVVLASCSSTYRATDQTTSTTVMAPDGVRTTFVTAYPSATNVVWYNYNQDQLFVPIDWELVGWDAVGPDDYVASFDMNGERYYAWYDADGTWVDRKSVV